MGVTGQYRVAIVGGGYAGFTLARELDPHVNVTLIEAREAFVMTPATPRVLVEPALFDRIVIPYDRLPEAEKAYDRNTASETLKAILSLGYRIQPPVSEAQPVHGGGTAGAEVVVPTM